MTTLDICAPFVPMRLLGLAPADGSPVGIEGTVLLADLVNFTGLCEALTARGGSEGGELISRALNQALGPAVDAVIERGGEVIKFSGDGLLCLFVGGENAIEAAQAASMDIADAAVRGPEGELHRFRSATVHGLVTLARIGGHRGRFELVAGGEAVDAAQRLAAGATPGEVGPHSALPLPLLAPMTENVAAITSSSYLPPYVISRQSKHMAQWLQEFRTLTIMFVSAAPTADRALLQDLALAIQVVVDGQGGQLLRFNLEGGRLVAEIAFGLVVDVAATGPWEAAHCATLLARDLPGTRVGVSTGRVLLGPIGSAVRRQLTSLGAPVNLAARLMQQADPGSVLADEATWVAAAGRFRASPMRAMLKGLGERRFWRLQSGDPPRLTDDEGFFGRGLEMSTVRHALDNDLTQVRPILIQGEAGIGKSSMTRWLVGELERRAVLVWKATATPVGRYTPYSGLAAVIAELCGLGPGLDTARQLAMVARNLWGDSERAPLLADALRVSLADTSTTLELVGAVRADNIRHALSTLLVDRARRGTTALVVDDAHWLDASSWALLQRLAAEVAGLRLVVVMRPLLQQDPPPLQFIRARQALVLDLEPLSPGDITAVVAHRMAASEVPPVVARWVIARARGNPFFAQELAAMLIAVGKVEVLDGAFTRAPCEAELNELPLATTIESTIEQRIECLGVEDAVALKVASVLGATFSLDTLADLALELGDTNIAALADRLVAANMAVFDGSDRLAFRHSYTQEAAYRMLPGDRRRELHASVARGIELRFGDRAAERAGELAHHWFAADDRSNAMTWLDLAGAQALHSGADREAAAHFRRALSLGDGQPVGRLASWHRQLARALLGLGRVESVAQEARKAFELVARPLPNSPLGWVALSLGSTLRRTLTPRLLLSTSSKRSAARFVDLLEGARAAGLLAESAYFVNAPEMMLGSALLAVELAERTASGAPVSVAYGMLGVVAGMARLHGAARRHLAQARSLSELAGDPLQQGVAWFYAGMYFGCIGDWSASLDAEQRALEFTERLGAHAQSGFQLTLIATNALYTSEYAKTRAWMATVGQRAERSANVQQQGWTCNVLSVADLHQALYADAIERSERARQIFLVERDRISLIISEGVHCAALCRLGRMPEALVAADRASAVIAGARPTTWGQLEGFAGPCEVYAVAQAHGLLTPAEARRRAAAAMMGLRLFALVFPFGRARYQWISALFDIGRQREAGASRSLRRSIDVARRFRMPFEEMRAADLLAARVGADERSALESRVRLLQSMMVPGAAVPRAEVQAV